MSPNLKSAADLFSALAAVCLSPLGPADRCPDSVLTMKLLEHLQALQRSASTTGVLRCGLRCGGRLLRRLSLRGRLGIWLCTLHGEVVGLRLRDTMKKHTSSALTLNRPAPGNCARKGSSEPKLNILEPLFQSER